MEKKNEVLVEAIKKLREVRSLILAYEPHIANKIDQTIIGLSNMNEFVLQELNKRK